MLFSSCYLTHRRKLYNYILSTEESDGATSKFVRIQPFIDRSSYQYWFWRGFIAFLVTSVYHFAQAVLYNVVRRVCLGRFLFPTRTRVPAVSSQAHIQTVSCMFYGWDHWVSFHSSRLILSSRLKPKYNLWTRTFYMYHMYKGALGLYPRTQSNSHVCMFTARITKKE